MSYTCRQEILVIEDSTTCSNAFDEYILSPAVQFIGLDCEWNTNRPVSLLQVATPTVVMLVRLCKLNFMLPDNVKLVLEDPTIIKVGVNIENDSDKLGEDCFCKIKSWIDLRHLAIRSCSWGQCIVKQVDNLEWELKFYDQYDPSSESAKKADGKRLSWCPKMGLESLIDECLGQRLPKNTSARWSDDWECAKLKSNQQTYAANDATAALDIFAIIVYTSVTRGVLPVDHSFDLISVFEEYSSQLERACKDLLDKKFLQTKEDMNLIYQLIETSAPHLDIKKYYTKPPSTKSSKSKQEKKEYYKKKAQEALQPNTLPVQQSAVPPATSPTNTDPFEPNISDPDTSRNSFTFREIKDALHHTKPTSNKLSENFVNMQSEEASNSITRQPYNPAEINFYFKHNSDYSAALIPGFSYGRGSIPPDGYRLVRFANSETQTDFNTNEDCFKKASCRFSSHEVCEILRTTSINTDHSFVFRAPPVNRPLNRTTDSPTPNSTTDDDAESGSSCTSSNGRSSASKQTRGRGRGRGKVPPAVGALKSTDSDVEAKRGRGRGRGVAGAGVEQIGCSSTGATSDQHNETAFSGEDIRYKDSANDRPTDLNFKVDRARTMTTSSVSSAATPRPSESVSPVTTPRPNSQSENTNMSDLTPTNSHQAPPTPTNSFSRCQQQRAPTRTHAPQTTNFEEAFFQDAASNYSSFSVADIIKPRPDPRGSFNMHDDRGRGHTPHTAGPFPAQSRRPEKGQMRAEQMAEFRAQSMRNKQRYQAPCGTNQARVTSTNIPTNPNENYEYKTDIFRQAKAREAGYEGAFSQHKKEEVVFDWSKFREDAGIVQEPESSDNNATFTVNLSDSSDAGDP